MAITLTTEQESRAQKIHSESIVFDCSSVVQQAPEHFDRARRGGVTGTNHTVTAPHSTFEEAAMDLASCAAWISQNSDRALLATTVADIEEAKRSGREAIVFGPQNSEFIGTDTDKLDVFYQLGMRIMQLTYQRQNWVGTGCGEPEDGGLTSFGRELVREMNERGILIDLSHCGTATAMQTFELTSQPAVFTHAHADAMSPSVRAKSDEVLKAMAAQGGVVGITALSVFNLNPAEPGKRQDISGFMRHVNHIVELVGVDHVGIGLDMDETNTPEKWAAESARHPEMKNTFGWDTRRISGLADSSDMPNVTRALVAAGYDDAEIVKMLGGNFLRVFKQVWGS